MRDLQRLPLQIALRGSRRAPREPRLVRGVTISRIGGGKLVENRTVQDFMGLMRQLGAERIPAQTPSQRL